MGRKIFLIFISLLLIVCFSWLVFMPSTPGLAASLGHAEALATPTVDANAVLNQANAAATQASQASAQTQSVLNLMNNFLAVIGVVLALFGVVTVGLGIFGFSTNNGFRDLDKEWRSRLSELTVILSQTQEKKDAVDFLQKELEERNNAIVVLQKEMEEKKQAIGDLDKTVLDFVTLQKTITQRFENTNKALAYLVLGNQLLEQKKNDEAIDVYERARTLLPDDEQINYIMGRIYSGIGHYDEALTLFEAAIRVNPDFAEAEMELGLAYRRRGEQQQGHDAEELSQEDYRQKDYRQAILHLKRAVELRKNYADALATLGGLYRRIQDYGMALEYYREAAQADPESSYALGNVASLEWYEGQQAVALENFRTVEQLAERRIAKPSMEFYWDYYDLALAQLAQGKESEAWRNYETAVKLTPSVASFEGVLNNLFLLQKSQASIPGLEKVIELLEQAQNTLR